MATFYTIGRIWLQQKSGFFFNITSIIDLYHYHRLRESISYHLAWCGPTFHIYHDDKDKTPFIDRIHHIPLPRLLLEQKLPSAIKRSLSLRVVSINQTDDSWVSYFWILFGISLLRGVIVNRNNSSIPWMTTRNFAQAFVVTGRYSFISWWWH